MSFLGERKDGGKEEEKKRQASWERRDRIWCMVVLLKFPTFSFLPECLAALFFPYACHTSAANLLMSMEASKQQIGSAHWQSCLHTSRKHSVLPKDEFSNARTSLRLGPQTPFQPKPTLGCVHKSCA